MHNMQEYNNNHCSHASMHFFFFAQVNKLTDTISLHVRYDPLSQAKLTQQALSWLEMEAVLLDCQRNRTCSHIHQLRRRKCERSCSGNAASENPAVITRQGHRRNFCKVEVLTLRCRINCGYRAAEFRLLSLSAAARHSRALSSEVEASATY